MIIFYLLIWGLFTSEQLTQVSLEISRKWGSWTRFQVAHGECSGSNYMLMDMQLTTDQLRAAIEAAELVDRHVVAEALGVQVPALLRRVERGRGVLPPVLHRPGGPLWTTSQLAEMRRT
ncbi:hypothetical protein [Microbacterium sp. NPDC055683]